MELTAVFVLVFGLMSLLLVVSAKLRETKQYYLMYNTVSNSKEYYAKEVTLLESIFESFEAAMKSAGVCYSWCNSFRLARLDRVCLLPFGLAPQKVFRAY